MPICATMFMRSPAIEQPGRQQDSGGEEQEQVDLPGVPALAGKGQDEAEQVDRQRQDPQEGDDRHFLGDAAGRGQQKDGSGHGQGDPQEPRFPCSDAGSMQPERVSRPCNPAARFARSERTVPQIASAAKSR